MDQELRAAQMTLGHCLRDLRKAAGFTQQQLAAATLTSRSSIACIETGRQNPDRTFWDRADKATGAAGVLVAAFEDLRLLARRAGAVRFRRAGRGCRGRGAGCRGEAQPSGDGRPEA